MEDEPSGLYKEVTFHTKNNNPAPLTVFLLCGVGYCTRGTNPSDAVSDVLTTVHQNRRTEL